MNSEMAYKLINTEFPDQNQTFIDSLESALWAVQKIKGSPGTIEDLIKPMSYNTANGETSVTKRCRIYVANLKRTLWFDIMPEQCPTHVQRRPIAYPAHN